MNATQKNKITRFLDDKIMSETVYDILLSAFLRKKAGDVNMQAASFLAIGLLQDAWAELQVNRVSSNDQENKLKQVGL